MSARGDAARRARWDAKDKQENLQLRVAYEAWLLVLPTHLIERLHRGMRAIFGNRMDNLRAFTSTHEERQAALALIKEINLAHDAGHGVGVIQPGQKELSMSLEQAIAANTAAIEALTAQLAKGGATASSAGTSKAAKDKPAADKPKHSREELAAVMDKVKGAKGTPVAKALIAETGKAAKLAEVADENVDALFSAAEAKLAEEDDM